MKKFFFVLICFLCFAAAGVGEEKTDFSFSVSADFGVMNGQIQEFVVYTDSNEELAVLSRLDWDVKNLYYLGNTFNFFYKNLQLYTGYRFGTKKNSGIMQDSDWQDESQPDFRTNFSEHNNRINLYSRFFLNFGYEFKIFPYFYFIPLLGIEYEDYSFTASNGYYDYTNDTPNGGTGTFSGDVISYEQIYSTFVLGLAFNTKNFSHFNCQVSGYIAPLFNKSGFDDHLLRNLQWWDRMENGIMIRGNGLLEFAFNSHQKLNINGGIQYIPLIVGQTYKKYGNNWYKINSYAGGKRYIWELGIRYIFYF